MQSKTTFGGGAPPTQHKSSLDMARRPDKITTSRIKNAITERKKSYALASEASSSMKVDSKNLDDSLLAARNQEYLNSEVPPPPARKRSIDNGSTQPTENENRVSHLKMPIQEVVEDQEVSHRKLIPHVLATVHTHLKIEKGGFTMDHDQSLDSILQGPP